VFRPNFQTGFRDKQTRKGAGRLRRALLMCVLCAVALIASFTPIPTYSRYVVNLSDSFTLYTTEFYLVPSLALSELTVDRTESFFTQGNDFSVANYIDSKSTTADTVFTIALEEEHPTGLFDLYMEGTEGKIPCPNNTISGTLHGGIADSETYRLYFKLKDPATPEGNYPVNIRLTSSEPYIRSYLFTINIQVPGSLIKIGDTEIYRPNVEIPAGEVMVFKDHGYEFLTVDDLLIPLVVNQEVERRGRPDLVGGSLYVPASIGDLLVDSYWPNDVINWDVEGHIILEPDIEIKKDSEVNMLSHRGDIILNGTIISGQPEPYKVCIKANEGTIHANGTKIFSKADINGEIGAELTSAGDRGISIHSVQIDLTRGANEHTCLNSQGLINLDQATIAGKGNISINSYEDISIVSSQISASAWGMGIQFKSSGLNRILWVANAILNANSITAQNLTVNGTPASGSITVTP
jgi:hypothetical protein